MALSLAILVSGMALIGWWIGSRIERGVISQSGYNAALYVDSFISPPLQDLHNSSTIGPESVVQIGTLLNQTALGQEIVALKVWGRGGQVIYSPDSALIGQVFPPGDSLQAAWRGEVTAEISSLDHAENVNERAYASRLLEIYSPVRASGTGEVIGVVEFYQPVEDLEQLIFRSQTQSWLVIGLITLLMYALLGGYVQWASRTIVRQQGELRGQVDQLSTLLGHNTQLTSRLRASAARTAAINERYLRRIGAELHDGPAQHLALAVLRLDRVAMACEPLPQDERLHSDLEQIQSSLQQAMQEVRNISAGLCLPHIEQLSPAEVVARVVRNHERVTNTRVAHDLDNAPAETCLATRITIYRIVQEALTNAFRHAGGKGQRVSLTASTPDTLILTIADSGPGIPLVPQSGWDEHMGIAGMRERAMSIGGEFTIATALGSGTEIQVTLPLQAKLEQV